jgi:Heterokaryon incompatibility protein (HET)
MRPNRLPTRLLDVNNAQKGKLRLISGQQLPVESPYVAFSHRWVAGPTPEWVTSMSNIVERRSTFDSSVLPDSIRDAILFTNRLSLRYLWVDSVCIIQDSPEDWRSESVKMLDVYGNSALTIFADCAKDDDDKFLKPRETGNFQQRRGTSLIIGTSTGASVKIDVLERYSRYHAVLPAKSSELFQTDVAMSELSGRGWIFQEQVISSRRLHFGNHQMYWMCEESFKAEDGSDLTVPYYFQWRFKKHEVEPILPFREYRSWAALVENYSHRALSRSEDKLRALSGLAELFSERYSDNHLAGCWSRCIQLDLLWVAKPPLERQEDQILDSALAWSKASGAPTWSWIAADGPVEYPHIRARNSPMSSEIKIHYDVLRAPQVSHGSNDVFATLPISYTPLRVRGIVERAICLGEFQDIKSAPNFAPPWYRGSKDFFGHILKLYTWGLEDLQPIGWMITDRLCEQLVRPMELLLLSAWELTGRCSGCDRVASRYRHFIVLDAVEGRVDVVRRVGYGWIHNRADHDNGGHYDEDEFYKTRWRSLPEEFDMV